MAKLDGGRFLMGAESDESFPADGEGPVRQVIVDPFFMDACPVTTDEFSEFVRKTNYRTEAERFEWSFVFHNQVASELVEDTVRNVSW